MDQPTRQDRFLTLLSRNQKIFFKVAHAYASRQADREDLVQEMVVQLWRSFDHYDDARPFSTWMYRIALNVAISYSRGETRRARNVVTADPSILADTVLAPEPDESREDLAVLRQLLLRLHELDRALVILYLEGHSYAAIADVVGLTESNVGTRLNRIKQKVRREWAEHQTRETAPWNSTT